jgi:flagellar biosynthetic protein FliO
MIVKLGIVLALLYGVLALVRRYAGGPSFGKRTSALQVEEALTLAPNRLVYLVRVRDERLLLGVTPTQITALARWDAESSASQPPSNQPDFEAVLSKLS